MAREGDHRAVISDDRNTGDHLANADALEQRIQGPNLYIASAGKLTQDHLQIVHWFADNDQNDNVRN